MIFFIFYLDFKKIRINFALLNNTKYGYFLLQDDNRKEKLPG